MSSLEETGKLLTEGKSPKSLKSLIEESANELGKALPEHLRPERIVRIALTVIRQNPELSKCTQESFLGALFTAAQLGVEPIAGRAYLLPFNNSRKKADGSWHTVKECQFILGYKGLVDLFYRHKNAINLDWGIVKELDYFVFEKGTNSKLEHSFVKTNEPRGKTLGYWVMANLINGGKPFHYMTVEECVDHAKQHSKTWDKKNNKFYESSPWFKDQDSMCLKTVLIQLMKILPMSIELQRAVEADETSRDFRKGVDDVLDLPDQVNWDAVEKEVEVKQKEQNG